MANKRKSLYVGGLPHSTTEDAVRTLFSEVGDISSIHLIMDRETGQSKGFAFVEMANDAEAMLAVSQFNGYQMDGRSLTVNETHPREDHGNYGGGRRGERTAFVNEVPASSRRSPAPSAAPTPHRPVHVDSDFEQFQRDNRFVQEREHYLRNHFANQWVAIFGEKVIDHAETLDALLKKLDAKDAVIGKAVIKHITDAPMLFT